MAKNKFDQIGGRAMTDNTQELDVILALLGAKIPQPKTMNEYRAMVAMLQETRQTITEWHTRKLNEAIRGEWTLISEVAHSANITAELFIGKARKDRLAELDTINADNEKARDDE